MNSSELNTFTLSDENEQITGTTTNNKNSTLVSINSNRNYLGSMIIDALRKSNTSQLSELAISVSNIFVFIKLIIFVIIIILITRTDIVLSDIYWEMKYFQKCRRYRNQSTKDA